MPGGTDTLRCVEELPVRFCTCAFGSVRNLGETCGEISEENQNAKCWVFLSFLLSFSSFGRFNCSVVVLMDLRQWSSSCLSDFWLLFVNNLKRKFTFWRQTCGLFYWYKHCI